MKYRERLLEAGVSLPGSAAEFMRWFDLMGLQRHIKVLGIFSRLYYRDGKPQYLKDLPRVLQYAKDAAAAYEETARIRRIHRRAHRAAISRGAGAGGAGDERVSIGTREPPT